MRSPVIRRLPAVVVLGVTFTLLLGPSVALGQEDTWSGSSITTPGAGPHATSSLTGAGEFRRSGTRSILDVEVTWGRFDGTFVDADEDTNCVPADPGSVPDTNDSNGQGDTAFVNRSYAFTTPDASFPCNGRFALRATATAAGLEQQKTLTRSFTVAVPPVPVPSVGAELDAESQPASKTGATGDDPAAVIVGWERIDGAEYPDFLGYRVLRTGPGDAGTVNVSGTLGAGAEQFVDQVEAPGRYVYSVLSLRNGADGPVPATSGPTAEVRVAGPAATTSTSPDDDDGGSGGGSSGTEPRATGRLTIPDVGAGSNRTPRRSSGVTVPRTPGTIDTGFDEELDYGERPQTDDDEPGDENALAGEGQSIIRTDESGPGLLGPVAGALVLLGWAGHVAYLNRLAKQF